MGSARINMTDDKQTIRIRKPKPRNPHVEELYDGTYAPKRQTPKNQYQRKEKHNNWKYVRDDDDDMS